LRYISFLLYVCLCAALVFYSGERKEELRAGLEGIGLSMETLQRQSGELFGNEDMETVSTGKPFVVVIDPGHGGIDPGKVGIDEIRECLKDHMTVFAGPSGVGKSSLLNQLVPGLGQETGELSEKIQRGKNTTRHSKLVPLAEGGFVADTPGFTSLYLDHLKYEDLEQYYPEFDEWRDQCRFYGCSHISEPGCGVKAGLAKGAIHQQRYDNYVELYKEIRKSNEENRYT